MRNVLAILGGIIIGALINGAIINVGPSLIPPPAGVDVTTVESLAKSIHLFEPKHFITPFLAHAIGTLAGALAAYLIATTHRARMAYVIGFIFLCGGVVASLMIPAPAWFIALDLLGAYIPMAWLAIQLGRMLKPDGALRH